MPEPDFVLVLTTLPSDRSAADVFARTLVEERLAACVNITGEIQSVYQWQGRIEQDQERQIVIKTTRSSLDRLRKRVHELHPYEVPEFIVLPVIDGSHGYLDWVRKSTEGAERG